MNCVACGGAVALFGRQGDYIYAKCDSCATLQLDPQPTPDELKAAYQAYAETGHMATEPGGAETYHVNHYEQVVAVLKEYGISGKVLDYGAGWGGLIERMQAEGIECEGVDLEPNMVQYCQEKNLPVKFGDLDSVEGTGYSALTMIAVFEHLVNHHDWLARANNLLAEKGIMVLIFPTALGARTLASIFRFGRRNAPLTNFGRVFAPPWHTVLFSIDGARQVFEASGFELLDVRYVRSSREPGLLSLVQIALEKINRVGWALMNRRWPLQIAHLFVVRKR